MLRTKDALALGVHSRTLYQLRDEGVLERVSRGVYRLAELPPLSHPDLVTVAVRVPRAVVCLVSAVEMESPSESTARKRPLPTASGTATRSGPTSPSKP